MTEDYATPQKLAMYLEAGWSDFLFEQPSNSITSKRETKPGIDDELVKPVFFQEVARLAKSWANEIALEIRSVCDIGGGTGRTIYELDREISGIDNLTLVEPSAAFCHWAGMLLASEIPLPDLPMVNTAAGPIYVSASGRPAPIPLGADRLKILNKNLEECAGLKNFDLVTCLNVVDRHHQPKDMISHIKDIMSPSGLLIISSPFDFDQNSTPDEDSWIDDLDSLFDNSWETIGESELFYEFRPFNRKWTRYSSQVLGKRRKTK